MFYWPCTNSRDRTRSYSCLCRLYQLAANSRAFYWHRGGCSVNINLLGLSPRTWLCVVPCVSGTRWPAWPWEHLVVGPGMGFASDLMCWALISERRAWLVRSAHPGGFSRPVPWAVRRWKEGRYQLLLSLERRHRLGRSEQKALIGASRGGEC